MNKLFFKIMFVLSLIIFSNQYLLAHQWTGESAISYNDGTEDHFTDYRAQIFYGSQTSNYNDMHKPVILFGRPEFGFKERYNSIDLYNHVNQADLLSVGPNNEIFHYQMLDLLRSEGFDVITVDFDLSKRIQTNAMALIELLDYVNSRTNDEITLFGLEVGGMISRYALTYMENSANNIEHNVKVHVTYDTPHQGINIPISIQWLLYEFVNIAPQVQTLITTYELGLDLNTLSQQLAIDFEEYYSIQQLMNVSFKRSHENSTNDNFEFLPSELRQQFLMELVQLGDYPNNCRNVAVSTGSPGVAQSNTGNDQARFFMKNHYEIESRWQNNQLDPVGFIFDLIVHPIRDSYTNAGNEGYLHDELFYESIDNNNEPDVYLGSLELFFEKFNGGDQDFDEIMNITSDYLIDYPNVSTDPTKMTIAFNEAGSYFVYEEMLRDFIEESELWGTLYHFDGGDINLGWINDILELFNYGITIFDFDFILFNEETIRFPEDWEKDKDKVNVNNKVDNEEKEAKTYSQNICYIPTSSALDHRDEQAIYVDFTEITLSSNSIVQKIDCEYDVSYMPTSNHPVASMGCGSISGRFYLENDILYEIFTNITSYNSIKKDNHFNKFTFELSAGDEYKFNKAYNNIYIGNDYQVLDLNNKIELKAGNEIIFESGTNLIPDEGNEDFETIIE